MVKKQQEGDEQPGAKAESEKHKGPGGVHMYFLLGFGYQLASIVLIAFALFAFGYFVTEKNWKGVIWSLFTVWCLVGLLAALYAHQHYFPFKTDTPNATPQNLPFSHEDVAEIKRQLADLYEHLKPPIEQITEKYPGLSIQGVIRLHAMQESRRKYLMDIGTRDKDRFSIYLDPDNVFTLAFVSASSEPYNVRIAPVDVPFGQFIYLSCELAIAENSTSLRVLINGSRVGALKLPFRVNPGSLDPTGSVIGADLDGNNGLRFDMASLVLYTSTLTTDEIKKLLEYFSTVPLSKFAQFNGKQWMRQAGKGKGVHQDIPEARPIFRDLEEPKN